MLFLLLLVIDWDTHIYLVPHGWWNSVQLKWHQNPANRLPLHIASGKSKGNMSSVMKGGPSGLVTLLIGLKWWASIRDSDPRWGLAVQDSIACFTSFTTGSMKRKGDDVVTEKSMKKKCKVGCVTCVCFLNLYHISFFFPLKLTGNAASESFFM
jgi:hypothetical protein